MRDLRNNGGEVLRRVERGEHIVVTRDGTPVAELHPLPRPSAGPAELIRRRKNLPQVNPDALWHDIDNMICTDSSVFPTSTGYGPTLTLVALAIRACRNLTGLPQLRSMRP